MEKEEQRKNSRALSGFKEHNIMLSKEYTTKSRITKMFPNEIIEEQYRALGYFIDLAFPVHKLGSEADENGHMDRSEAKKKKDKKQWKKKLVSQLSELIQTRKILIFLLKLPKYKITMFNKPKK